MQRFATPIAAALAIAGCAHDAPPGLPVAAAVPPDLALFLSRYEGRKVCETQDENFVMPVYVREPGDLRPVPTEFCAPVFPPALQHRNYEARCAVRFRIGEDGATLTEGAKCAVSPAATGDADWDAFAKAAFEGLSERAVALSRYAPSPDAEKDAVHAQPLRFLFAD